MASGSTGRSVIGRLARRAVRIGLWMVVAILGLVAALIGAAHTDWGRGLIRDQAMAALAPLFTGEVSLGRIDGSVLDRFSLRDITLHDATGQPAVHIAEVAVDTDLWQLWHGVVAVEEVIVSQPEIMARVLPDGSLNLDGLLAPVPDSEPSTWIVELSRLEVRSGAFTLITLDGSRETLDDLEFLASVRIDGDDIAATLESTSRWQRDRRPVSVRARLEMTATAVVVNDLRISLGPAWLAIPAGRYDLASGGLDLTTNAHVPAAELNQLALASGASAPSGAAGSTSGDLDIRSDLGLSGTIRRQSKEHALELDLALDTAGGAVAITAKGSPASADSGHPEIAVEVATSDLDLAGISPQLPSSGLSARFTGSATGSSLQDLEAEAGLEASGTLAGHRLPELRSQVTLADLRSAFTVALTWPDPRGDRVTLDGALRLREGWARKLAEASNETSGETSGETPGETSGEAPITADDVVIERARLRVAIPDLQRALGQVPEIVGLVLPAPGAAPRGAVAVDVNASGPLSSLSVNGQVQGTKLRWDQTTASKFSADIALSGLPGRIAGQARLGATGIVQAGTAVGDVSATIHATRPGRFQVAVTASGSQAVLPFAIAGEVVQRGDGATITLGDYRVTTGPLVWKGRDGVVAIDPAGQLRIAGVALASSAGQLAVDGTMAAAGPLRGRGVIDVHDVDIAAIQGVVTSLVPDLSLPAEPLGGAAALRAEVEVRGQTITAELATALSRLTIGDTPGIDVDLRLGLQNRILTTDVVLRSAPVGAATLSLTASAPARPLDPAAWSQLDESALQELTVVISRLQLAGLEPWLPGVAESGVQGQVAATLKVAGGVQGARGTVTATNLLVTPLTAPLDAHSYLALDGRELVLSAHIAGGSRGAVDARVLATLPAQLSDSAAWAALDERAINAASVSLSAIDLEHWASLAGVQLGFPARADLSLDASPGLESLTMNGQVAIPPGAGVAGLPAVTTRITGVIDRSQISGSLGVALGGVERITGRARLAAGLDALRQGDPLVLQAARADAEFRLLALPVREVIELLQAAAVVAPVDSPAGSLQGTMQLAGTMNAPRLSATITGDAVSLAGVTVPKLTTRASYAGQQLSVELRADQARNRWLSLRAGVTLPEGFPGLEAGTAGTAGTAGKPGERRPPGATGAPSPADESALDLAGWKTETSLRARDFDLSFLTALVPDLGLAGKLDSDLAITGTLESPRFRGSARLRDGVIRPGPPVRRIHGADIKLTCTDNRIALDVSARAGQGDLQVSGQARLDDLAHPEVAATIVTRSMPLELGTTIAALSTRTQISGRLGDDGWQLATDIGRTHVALPDQEGHELHPLAPPEDVVFLDARCSDPDGCESPPALPPLRMTIRSRDTIRVRGDEVRALVGADLVVDTRSGELSIGGQVVVNNGWIELVGRRYRLTRAVASFDAAPEPIPDPALDIALVHDFSTVTIHIQVQGTALSPELTMRSEPAIYDEAEILAIVLGAEPGAPEQDRSLGNRATSIASGLLASQVQSLVRDALPVDVIRLELDDGSGEGTVNSVLIGKWITDDLFLSYGHHFDAGPNENSGQVAIEYRLRRRWMLEASYGDRGVGGLDLLWVKRY